MSDIDGVENLDKPPVRLNVAAVRLPDGKMAYDFETMSPYSYPKMTALEEAEVLKSRPLEPQVIVTGAMMVICVAPTAEEQAALLAQVSELLKNQGTEAVPDAENLAKLMESGLPVVKIFGPSFKDAPTDVQVRARHADDMAWIRWRCDNNFYGPPMPDYKPLETRLWNHQIKMIEELEERRGPSLKDLAAKYAGKPYTATHLGVFAAMYGSPTKPAPKERPEPWEERTVAIWTSWIGQKVRKISAKPFKSRFKWATVKGIIEHPVTGRPGFTFEEDESVVECRICTLGMGTPQNYTAASWEQALGRAKRDGKITKIDPPATTHFIQCASDKDACPIIPGDSRITMIHVPPLEDAKLAVIEETPPTSSTSSQRVKDWVARQELPIRPMFTKPLKGRRWE